MSEHAESTAATVLEELPNRLFQLELTDGTLVIAGLSRELERLGTTFEAGQRVLVRRARLDPSRGVIVGLTR